MQKDRQQWVAVAGVVVHDGCALCLKRAPHREAAPGLWEVVSGRAVPGEDPYAAIAREIGEETGLEPTIVKRPVAVYSAKRAGEPMVVILYRATVEGGRPAVTLSDEHVEYAWWTPDELLEAGSPRRLVEAVRLAVTLDFPSD